MLGFVTHKLTASREDIVGAQRSRHSGHCGCLRRFQGGAVISAVDILFRIFLFANWALLIARFLDSFFHLVAPKNRAQRVFRAPSAGESNLISEILPLELPYSGW
jgi:hypothetical protein